MKLNKSADIAQVWFNIVKHYEGYVFTPTM